MKARIHFTKNNFILGMGFYKSDNEIHINTLWFSLEIITGV